ncbi:MAG: hypothetical protein HFP77_03265 [Methylococcales symbiont of Iophon sp. n. MRB-2018]|nr:MAG: hypothetical protein HFP77_03265 [Methylococcales symbiont of Iophon sp. n. MRB-2018]KAF3980285.1 MAG: hypothetical protein HFP76_02825 [Methylococcales symbiont of Iophon sp. n. MRB-2018]
MESLKDKFECKYEATLKNFKELSLDGDKNQSLCVNTSHKHCNFDTITQQICSSQNINQRQSADTIIFLDKTIYCVEFKNKALPGIKLRDFKQKIIDSKKTLLEILNSLRENHKEYRFIFCAVHNGHQESKEEKLNNIELQYQYNFEHQNLLELNLKQFNVDKGNIFNEIFAEDVDFFRQQFTEKIDGNLPC